jgi:hypothetical protein
MSAPGPVSRVREAKTRLRARIAARRRRCADLGARVARPLHWLDRIEAGWRSLGPLGNIGSAAAALLAWRWFEPTASVPSPADQPAGWKQLLRWLFSHWA